MKNKVISLLSGLTLVGGLAVNPAAYATTSADVTKALAHSTTMELPAKAASLVTMASAADKQSVTVAVVKAAIGLNAASAKDVVSSVAQASPATAPIAAVTAVTLKHNQIALITKAATSGAPGEAAKIVAALIKQFPKDYGVIAIAASEGAPLAKREILAVVADSVPGVQAFIQSALANNSDVAVQAVVTQAAVSDTSASAAPTQSPAPAAPSLSGPGIGSGGFQTYSGTVTSLTPANLTTEGAGTRPYAGP
jgi:hypothetical protein